MISLAPIEEAVRAGKIDEARQALHRLNRKGKWGSCDPVKLANLLWRTGEPSRGIRLLSQRFLEISEKSLRAKPEEAAEYAACLTRVGAFLEAGWILRLPEVAETPMAALYEGLCLVTEWDYARAIPKFTEFVGTSGVSEYQLRIGYANLAAALVYERRHREATPILRRLMYDSQLVNNSLLMGFVLEVASADRVLSADYKDARRFLKEADRQWAQADDYHRALVEKWTALLDLAEKKDRTGVERMRTRAAEIQDWETLRDCDKYVALWTKNESLFHKIYFGTPFPAYRERLRRDFGSAEIPSEYGVELGGPGAKRRDVRFLSSALERKRSGLTSQSFALASLLASDLYRPHRLATLYGWLYPDQHFHPDHLGKRMNQALRRLNLWAQESQTPLFAEEIDSSYRLQGTERITLWIPRPGDTSLTWQPLIVRLETKFGNRPFSTSDAVEALDHPRSSLVRQLQSLVVSGLLLQSGKGPSSRYQLKAIAKAA